MLYIAPMRNPWTISGPRVYLPAAGGCPEVREAPSVLYHNDSAFLVYSTCDTGKPDYQLWMKILPPGADPLDRAQWRQHPGPVFTRYDPAGVYGPGSNALFRSPDGHEDWIVYHAKDHIRVYLRRTNNPSSKNHLEIGWKPQPGSTHRAGRRHSAPLRGPVARTHRLDKVREVPDASKEAGRLRPLTPSENRSLTRSAMASM